MKSPAVLIEWQPGQHDRSPALRHEEALPPDGAVLTVLGAESIGWSASVRLQLPRAVTSDEAKSRAARVYAACRAAMERVLEEGA